MTGNDNLTPFRKITPPANDHKPPHEPAINLPPAVKGLAIAMIAVFLAQQLLSPVQEEDLVMSLGFIPARYTGGMDFGWRAVVSPVAHLFIHGGWMHLIMNIGMLAAFGTAFEKAAGGKKMLALFFLGGLGAALFHFIFYSQLPYPMIGASGAISALFAAVVLMMQKQGMMGEGRQSFVIFIGVWICLSLFFGFFGMPGESSPIAWTAHIGGFIAGLLLARPVTAYK